MKPQYYNGRPAFGIAFLKKAPEARVKTLLKILDYVAAPKLVQEIFRLREIRRDGGGAAPSVAPATAVDSAAEAV